MKAYWGSGGIGPRILWPRHWMEVVSFTPLPPYPQGKSPWYPLAGWSSEPVWTWLRREKSLSLLEIEPRSSNPQPVTSLLDTEVVKVENYVVSFFELSTEQNILTLEGGCNWEQENSCLMLTGYLRRSEGVVCNAHGGS
jgi:hypothetical protein